MRPLTSAKVVDEKPSSRSDAPRGLVATLAAPLFRRHILLFSHVRVKYRGRAQFSIFRRAVEPARANRILLCPMSVCATILLWHTCYACPTRKIFPHLKKISVSDLLQACLVSFHLEMRHMQITVFDVLAL